MEFWQLICLVQVFFASLGLGWQPGAFSLKIGPNLHPSQGSAQIESSWGTLSITVHESRARVSEFLEALDTIR